MTTTQIMKPSDEAKTPSPAKVQSAAPSTSPTASTAIPPAMPAWPNHFGIFRARQAASDDPMIAVRGGAGVGRPDHSRLQRDEGGGAEHDDAREEPVGVEADEARPQARDVPEEREGGAREERRRRIRVVGAQDERRERECDVEVSECRQLRPRHAAKLQHRR